MTLPLQYDYFVAVSFIRHHGNKYRYHKDTFIDSQSKTKIYCFKHGDFWQSPSNHMLGKGCPVCAREKLSRSRTTPLPEVKAKIQKIFGDKYNYDFSGYTGNEKPIRIKCPKHGWFSQTVRCHLVSPTGCPKCSDVRTGEFQVFTLEEVINKFREMHGGKYDYSLVEYKNNHTRVKIICPEHGEFAQLPAGHFKGKGCPTCGDIAGGKKRLAAKRASLIERFKKSHGDRYDYSKVDYQGAHSKVEVICRNHGSFWVVPDSHVQGCGCPKCANISIARKQRLSRIEVLKRFKKVHGKTYKYDLTGFVNTDSKVKIYCPDHGWFKQQVWSHIKGSGCPKCADEYTGIRCRSLAYYNLAAYKTYGRRLETVGLKTEVHKDGSFSVKCYKCGKWTVVTRDQACHKSTAIKTPGGGAEIYCSKECKEACSVFGQHSNSFIRKARACTPESRKIFLQIQKDSCGFNFCEKCGEENLPKDLQLHHTQEVRKQGREVLNPSGHMLLCKKCHKEFTNQCRDY